MRHYYILIVFSWTFVLFGYAQPGNTPFANRSLSNLLNPTAVNAHLLPWKANNINLGSATKTWKNIYFAGDIYKGSNRFISSDTPGNTFLGILAGRSNTGPHNTAIGDSAMYSNTTGNNNTATGFTALYSNIDGGANNAYGHQALFNNNGFGNDAFGLATLYNNTTGFFNVASGLAALVNNTEGFSNVASGAFALVQNSTGIFNTAIGVGAIEGNTTKSFNTAIGGEAGGLSLDFSNATFLGAQSNTDPGLTNITAVGYQARTTASNQVMVGNPFVTSIGGYANWSNFSDGRYKKNIQEDVPGLEFITQLRPVTYTLDVDGIENVNKASVQKTSTPSIPGLTDKIPFDAGAMKKAGNQHSPEELKARQEKTKVVYTGFIAQEVEDAAKKLQYNFSGVDAPKTGKSFYALRYGDFVVPLVKAVQEQQKQIDEQQKQIAELGALVQSVTEQSVPGTTNFSTAFIKQNAPNPFSKSTVINYYIPNNISNAKIMVTDMTGRLVRIYTAKQGEGLINISGGDMPAATYQYTLLADGKKIDTKQMTLFK